MARAVVPGVHKRIDRALIVILPGAHETLRNTRDEVTPIAGARLDTQRREHRLGEIGNADGI